MPTLTELSPAAVSPLVWQLELARMGFSLARLGFYRWLVDNGRDPEYQVRQ